MAIYRRYTQVEKSYRLGIQFEINISVTVFIIMSVTTLYISSGFDTKNSKQNIHRAKKTSESFFRTQTKLEDMQF